MSFQDYWQTFLSDLIELLPESRRAPILAILGASFAEGDLPGREFTQRLIERDLDLVTDNQFASWSMREDADDGSQRILELLATGKCVGGSRADALCYLSNIEYSDAFARRIQRAGDDGLLTPAEVNQVLATCLWNPPLPALIERPVHVPDLPFDRMAEADAPCRCVIAGSSGRPSQGNRWQ